MNYQSTNGRPAGGRVLSAPSAGFAPSLERKRIQMYLLEVVLDSLLVLCCFALVGYLVHGEYLRGSPWLIGMLALPIFLTIAFHNATYSIATLADWKKGAFRAISALVLSGVLLNFMAFFVKLNETFSRLAFVGGMVLAAALMLAYRVAVARVVKNRWGPNPKNVLIIQAGGPKVKIRDAYRVDAAEHGLTASLDDPHLFDRLGKYLRNMDEVIVSSDSEHRKMWSTMLKASGMHGEIVTKSVRDIGALGVVNHEGDLSTLLVSAGPLGFRSRLLKRGLDLAVGGLALVLLSPIIALAASLIKLEDGGPVFFRQDRIGRANRLFGIWKLRTMRQDACDAHGTVSTAGRSDARVTRIGGFLRKTSIDELPQLINVLTGDMSLVGPRPHAIGSQAGTKLFWEVDDQYWLRHSLRPGLTGLAQIRGFRGATHKESDLSDRLKADLEYLRGWTIWRDIGILLSTARVLVHHRAF
ncbi:exopolysaccharide biosynthesis polyprenyl glycosylphosphotransferase [Paraurantiacibacter namhicola]|uniref:UDP-glucose:undecaprenyl-phosphate glucose-1-phosphate transferase n=1 Tax=Paraurantiacibacter namhicola TaxID=645517 RepID=A0A1C7D5Y5_9SPHN|nr:exopolysaccharide biosynthesis polyprenyl glycosylphosphotransferase [Paraurantiacibacter namhicola]ANU06875.1 UDP-glucose:undecaprenyl-phosphate glucose-1-phosphate transferase [Paraurantiacibacter namhicola]